MVKIVIFEQFSLSECNVFKNNIPETKSSTDVAHSSHHLGLMKILFLLENCCKLSQLNQNKAIWFSFTLVSTQSNNRTERMTEIDLTKTKLASFNMH